MTRCTHCYKDTAVWGHDGKCPDCIAATTGFGKDEGGTRMTSQYTCHVYATPCGCEYRDNTKTKWCAHHVSGMQETIKARDASIARYSTDLREARKKRDEWKAKAELAELGEDASASMIAAICAYAGIENDPNGTLDAFANKVIARVKGLERENDALQDAVKHLREQIPDDMSSNATHYCCMHQRWETREGAEV